MCPRASTVSNRIINGVVDRMLVLRDSDLPSNVVAVLKQEFTKSNPKFYRLQSLGKWVGNIPKTIVGYEHDDGLLLLPRGAVDRVEEILFDSGVEVSWRDDTLRAKEPSKIVFSGTLRPYQQIAVGMLAGKKTTGSMWPVYPNGTLRGPPGCGKTTIALGVIAERKVPTIVVVHSTALLQQWREACAHFLGFAPGTIQGKTADIKLVTMAMQQTLWRQMGKKPPAYAREFEIVLIDECQHASSATYDAVAQLFPGTQRIGVSADERRKDGLEFVVEWTFGPVLHEIHTEDLISIGRLVPIKMSVVPTDYVDGVFLDSVAEDSHPDWVSMVGRMTKDIERNQQIINRAVRTLMDDPDARILILTERVEHVEMLAGQLFMHNVKVGKMLGGQDNRKELERTKRGLQAGRIQVGVGSRVADEGLDIPALTDVFLTCPVHTHPKRIRQMIGRAARPHGNKKVGRATYFWDWRMFPPYPKNDSRRERGVQNFVRKLEKGVGPAGTVKIEY